jgi:hypothetical protein
LAGASYLQANLLFPGLLAARSLLHLLVAESSVKCLSCSLRLSGSAQSPPHEMLKHCLPFALVFAQLVPAEPVNPELRDDVSSCASVKTVTTTVTSAITVTVEASTVAINTTGSADATGPCHPSGSGKDASNTDHLSISPTTAAGNEANRSSQEAVEPTVSSTTVVLPSASQSVPEPPPAGRSFSNMLYFGAW